MHVTIQIVERIIVNVAQGSVVPIGRYTACWDHFEINFININFAI